METGEKKIAVLIDADNVSADYLSFIFDELSNHGAPTIKRIYGDFTNARLVKWKSVLLDYSITPIQQYSYTTGKNATDSALIIDAMDILYAQNVDGFCIVSSDSDFTRLAARLREAGKFVIGMGEKKTPAPFVNACEQFKYLEVLKDANNDMEQDAPKANSPHIQTSSPSRSALEKAISSILNDVSDADGWASLGTVGQRLNTRYSAFDSRNYGYSKLSQLVDSFDRFDVQARKMPNQHEAQTFIRFSPNSGKQQKNVRSHSPGPQKTQPKPETRSDRMPKKRTPVRPLHPNEPRRRNQTYLSDEDFVIPVREDIDEPAAVLEDAFSVSDGFYPANEREVPSREPEPLFADTPDLPPIPQAPFRLSDYPDLFGDLSRLDENKLLGAMLESTSERRGKADQISERRQNRSERKGSGEAKPDDDFRKETPAPQAAPKVPYETQSRDNTVNAEPPVIQEEPAPEEEPKKRRGRKQAAEFPAPEAAPAEIPAAEGGSSETVKPAKRGRKQASEEAAAQTPDVPAATWAAEETPKKATRRGRRKAEDAAEAEAKPAETAVSENVAAFPSEIIAAATASVPEATSTTENTSAADAEVTPKKTTRRTRKKTTEEPAAEPVPAEAAEEAPKKTTRRTRKKTTEEPAAEPVPAEAAAEETPKKTTRRTRKKTVEEPAAEPVPAEAAAEETPKKTTRRTRKKTTEEPAAEPVPAEAAAEETPKKTTRRTRKKTAEEPTAEPVPAEAAAEETPKKTTRRTRKKTTEEPASETPAAETEEAPKKTTRRTRKKVAEESPAPDAEAEEASKPEAPGPGDVPSPEPGV